MLRSRKTPIVFFNFPLFVIQVSTLSARSFSRKGKDLFPLSCPKEFVWFFFECKVNLLKVYLQSTKRQQLASFQSNVYLFSLKRNNLEAKKKHSGLQEKLATVESHHFSHRNSIVFIWSSLFLSRCLCTKTRY